MRLVCVGRGRCVWVGAGAQSIRWFNGHAHACVTVRRHQHRSKLYEYCALSSSLSSSRFSARRPSRVGRWIVSSVGSFSSAASIRLIDAARMADWSDEAATSTGGADKFGEADGAGGDAAEGCGPARARRCAGSDLFRASGLLAACTGLGDKTARAAFRPTKLRCRPPVYFTDSPAPRIYKRHPGQRNAADHRQYSTDPSPES